MAMAVSPMYESETSLRPWGDPITIRGTESREQTRSEAKVRETSIEVKEVTVAPDPNRTLQGGQEDWHHHQGSNDGHGSTDEPAGDSEQQSPIPALLRKYSDSFRVALPKNLRRCHVVGACEVALRRGAFSGVHQVRRVLAGERDPGLPVEVRPTFPILANAG